MWYFIFYIYHKAIKNIQVILTRILKQFFWFLLSLKVAETIHEMLTFIFLATYIGNNYSLCNTREEGNQGPKQVLLE